MTNCPNCNKSLGGMFGGQLVHQKMTDLINNRLGMNKEAYCSSCSDDLLYKIDDQVRNSRENFQKRLSEIIHVIPVISSPAPINWNYEVIDMVTAQRTSGTGFITELSQSFNDLFGQGSGTTDRKIEAATAWCKSYLRSQCVKLGGNAIISTDIDFSEVGTGSSNMLLVCMAGTAIKVKDINSISEENGAILLEINNIASQVAALPKLVMSRF